MLLLIPATVTAAECTTQASIGSSDSGLRTNDVASVDIAGAGGVPLEVTTWLGQRGYILGQARSRPGELGMSMYAQGGVNNSLSGRCLLWETIVAHDSRRPGLPLEADLIVAFSGSETGLPGSTGGYARANGGVGLIVPIPYQGGVSTNISFFGQTNLNIGAVLWHRFGMVEGSPLSLSAELDVSVGTTGALGEDAGITADFGARLFVRPVDPAVSVTSASGFPYLLPNSTPAFVEARIIGHSLGLNWPLDRRGWRLVANTNGFGGVWNTNGCSDCLGSKWFTLFGAGCTNDIVIPINPNLRSAFFQLLWP